MFNLKNSSALVILATLLCGHGAVAMYNDLPPYARPSAPAAGGGGATSAEIAAEETAAAERSLARSNSSATAGCAAAAATDSDESARHALIEKDLAKFKATSDYARRLNTAVVEAIDQDVAAHMKTGAGLDNLRRAQCDAVPPAIAAIEQYYASSDEGQARINAQKDYILGPELGEVYRDYPQDPEFRKRVEAEKQRLVTEAARAELRQQNSTASTKATSSAGGAAAVAGDGGATAEEIAAAEERALAERAFVRSIPSAAAGGGAAEEDLPPYARAGGAAAAATDRDEPAKDIAVARQALIVKDLAAYKTRATYTTMLEAAVKKAITQGVEQYLKTEALGSLDHARDDAVSRVVMCIGQDYASTDGGKARIAQVKQKLVTKAARAELARGSAAAAYEKAEGAGEDIR